MKNDLVKEEFLELVSALYERIKDMHENEQESYLTKMKDNLYEADALQERKSLFALSFRVAVNEFWGLFLDQIKENVPASLGEKIEPFCINTQVREMEYMVRSLLALGYVPQALAARLITREFAFKDMHDFLNKRGATNLAGLVSQQIETLVPEVAPATG